MSFFIFAIEQSSSSYIHMISILYDADCFKEEFDVFEWMFSECIWEIFSERDSFERDFLCDEKTLCSRYIMRKYCHGITSILKISHLTECDQFIAQIFCSCRCEENDFHIICDGDCEYTRLFYHPHR